MPSLYELVVDTPLPAAFSIVGFARRPWDDDKFRAEMQTAVTSALKDQVDAAGWQSFAQRLSYVNSNFDDPAGLCAFEGGIGPARPGAQHRWQPNLLSRHAAELLPHHHQ